MKFAKKLTALLLAGLFTLPLASCAPSSAEKNPAGESNTNAPLKKISFVLDWTPNTNHTGLYVANAKGFFKEAGIEVSILQPPEDGSNMAVASGQAQFGVGFQEQLAPALTTENPLPITAVAAILEHNTSGLISTKDKNIDAFKALEGKTYATWDSPQEQEIIRQCMADEGADYSKLKMVPNSGADSLSMMQSGDVDVVWVFEGWDVQMAELAGIDYNFIRFDQASPIFDFYTPVVIANNDFLKNDPETSKAFLAALQKGYQYAIDHPDEAAEILCSAVPELTLDLVKKSQNYMKDQYSAEKSTWGAIDETRWTNFNHWMFQKGIIEKELGSAGFTNEYLPG